MPQIDLNNFEKTDPLKILAYQYDLVCNGVELSSGAIRNHMPKMMYKVFSKVGYSKKDVTNKSLNVPSYTCLNLLSKANLIILFEFLLLN